MSIFVSKIYLLKLYNKNCTYDINRLFYSDQNIVRKFVAVPDNVLANEDKLQEVQYTEAEFESIRGKLEEFQQRARRVHIMILIITKKNIFAICKCRGI